MNTPAPKKKRTPSASKKKHQDLWLEAFKRTFTILGACETVGISRQAVNLWRAEPEFARRFADLKLDLVDRLKNKGLVKAITDGDNDMIKFFLRAHEPETYREKQDLDIKHSGVVAQAHIDTADIPQETLLKLLKALEQPD